MIFRYRHCRMYFIFSLLRKFVTPQRLENFRSSGSDLLEFEFEQYCWSVFHNSIYIYESWYYVFFRIFSRLDNVDFGVEFIEKLDAIASIPDRQAIKERCHACLLEAARQVQIRNQTSHTWTTAYL